MGRSVGIRRKSCHKVKSQKLSWADAPPTVITKILSKFDRWVLVNYAATIPKKIEKIREISKKFTIFETQCQKKN